MTTSLIPDFWAAFPDEFRNRIGNSIGRQRLMMAQGQLLFLLHKPPKAHEEKRTGHLFWKNQNGIWQSNVFPTSAKPLFDHLREYKTRLDEFEQMEEKATNASDYFTVLEGISPLYRATKHLHEVLQHARDQNPLERDLILLRDEAYALERSAELLYTETKHALDFMVAKQSEALANASHNMSVAAHRLNVLVAFFFPISILTTLVGISYQDVISGSFPLYGFVTMVVLGLFLGIVITVLITKSKKHN